MRASSYNMQAGILSEAYKNVYEYYSPFYTKHHIYIDQYIR